MHFARMALSSVVLCAVACSANDGSDAAASNGRADTTSAGGDVTPRPVAGKWLTDGSIVSLIGVLNQHEVAAAGTEFQAWHSDSVRAFAASMIQDHAAMQHSVDSAAAVAGVAPVMPALGLELQDSLKTVVDGLKTLKGAPLDRAYLDGEVASHAMLVDYYEELAGVAQHPAIVSALANAVTTLQLHARRAQRIRSTLAMIDSARRMDSLAARQGRRSGATTTLPR